MHFLFNLSIQPWFLALLDDDGVIQTLETWDDLKASSQVIWDWIEAHQADLSGLKSVRSITGPGGFSSLRVTGLIAESLAEKYGVRLYTVRADHVVSQFFKDTDITSPIILNAFGENVFMNKKIDQELELIPTKAIPKRFPETVFTRFLPPEKQSLFPKAIPASFALEDLIKALHKATEKQDPVEKFIPYYGHPGV